jgi:hypothetical protein
MVVTNMTTESRIKNAVQYAEYNAYLMNQSKQKIFSNSPYVWIETVDALHSQTVETKGQ